MPASRRLIRSDAPDAAPANTAARLAAALARFAFVEDALSPHAAALVAEASGCFADGHALATIVLAAAALEAEAAHQGALRAGRAGPAALPAAGIRTPSLEELAPDLDAGLAWEAAWLRRTRNHILHPTQEAHLEADALALDAAGLEEAADRALTVAAGVLARLV